MNATDPAEYEDRPGRDVLEYLEIPFRYPRHVFVPLAVVMAIAVLLALTVPKKYRSATLILVESKSVPAEYYVSPATAEAMAQRLNTIRQVVLSRTRLEQVIDKLDPYPEMASQPRHVVVEAMRGAIEIRVYGSDSFVFEYVNRSPYKAMVVTSMLAQQFIEDADRLRERLTNKAIDLLQANLLRARKALDDHEQALRRYEQNNWGSLPDRLESNLRMLQQLQFEQQTLGENLRTLEQRRAALEGGLLEGKRLVAATPGASGPTAELAKLRATYDSLRGRYTNEHPDMRTLRARMDMLERQIAGQSEGSSTSESLSDPEAASLRQSLRLVEADVESLHARRNHLDERIALFQARVEATPKAKQGLAALARDYQQLQDEYNLALKREKDAEMARRLEEYWRSGYFSVLDPAYLPGRPIWPYAAMYLFGGLLLGLVVALGSALIADLLDRSVKSERELEEILPYPLLVTIPHVADPPKSSRTAVA